LKGGDYVVLAALLLASGVIINRRDDEECGSIRSSTKRPYDG